MTTQRYQDANLNIQLELPAGWEVTSTPQIPLALLAPESDGFRANMTFSMKTLSPPTPEAFDGLIAASRRIREDTYKGYNLLAAERFMQGGYPGYIERYHWEDDNAGTPLTQIFAVILTGEEGLYTIHVTSLRQSEGTYIPQMTDVVKSLQFG